MDGYNFRVMIRCADCGEICQRWAGDKRADGEPVCPPCAERDEPGMESSGLYEGTWCDTCMGSGFVYLGQFDGSGEIGVECPDC